MANLVDYLEWRGDLTFEQAPFNEVDNLLLSAASFVDLLGVVSSEPWGMPVKLSACEERYREKYPNGRYYGLTIPASLGPVFRKMAGCARFSDVYVTFYCSELDEEEGKQFGAVTLVLPDNSLFVSFRGTDDTLTGWREDFRLGYECPVPSQKAALRYLEEAASFHRGPIRVGGHSKGGNLAVYAGAMASYSVQRRILAVYSNDGPGFPEEFQASAGYHAIAGRVQAFVPQSSVVGLLFWSGGGYQVIESTGQMGILQHDPLSWKVLGPSFVHLDSLSEEGLRHDAAFRSLFQSMDREKRRRFVEVLFEVVEATGAKTLTEISASKVRSAMLMLKAYNDLDKEEKEVVWEFFRALTNEP